MSEEVELAGFWWAETLVAPPTVGMWVLRDDLRVAPRGEVMWAASREVGGNCGRGWARAWP